MVQYESGSGDSMGGEDTCYHALTVAAAIERWSSPEMGLVASSPFFGELRRLEKYAEEQAKQAQFEAVRCRSLLDAMTMRAELAASEAARRGWSNPYVPTLNCTEAS